MANTQKVKINIEDLFLPNMHTKESMAATTRHPVWPIAVACYGVGEGKAVIGQVTANTIRIVNRLGFYVAELQENKGNENSEYYVKMASGATNAQFSTYSIVSKNIRYIVNKLGKNSVHPVKSAIMGRIHDAETFINDKLGSMLNDGLNQISDVKPRGTPMINFPDSVATALMLLCKGVLKPEDMTSNFLSVIDEKYKQYVSQAGNFKKVITDAREFFNEDKWFLINGISGGAVLGAIGKQPILAMLDKIEQENSLSINRPDRYSYLDTLLPFRWYKSLDDIPEEIKPQVNMQLMMLKTHTNNSTLLPEHTEMQGHKFWPGVGAVVGREWGGASYLVFTK
jgi:hypothetical protein